MEDVLPRFTPFTGLTHEALKKLSPYARLLDVPSGRWLVRRGRVLHGRYFLVRGAVQTFQPDRLIDVSHAAAREAIYPGVLELLTMSECRLLQVADEAFELLTLQQSLQQGLDAEGRAGLATLTESDHCWQTRFLRSNLMTTLEPRVWQRVLSQLEPMAFDRGDVVIREGIRSVADACFILARGRALVLKGVLPVCHLGPGDLFGEDALISCLPRNATVQMLESGVVMRLSAARFSGFLGDVLDDGVFNEPRSAQGSEHLAVRAGRVALFFQSAVDLREQIAELEQGVTYLVSASSEQLCALALFLMRKRGLKAWTDC